MRCAVSEASRKWTRWIFSGWCVSACSGWAWTSPSLRVRSTKVFPVVRKSATRYCNSRLDIDALKTVADGVNAMRAPDRAIVLVTHYQRLLDYIVPDHVHVLSQGSIVKSGGAELAHELEQHGYGWVGAEHAARQVA